MLGTSISFFSNDGGTQYVINDNFSYPNLWAEEPFYFISVTSVDGLYSSDISFESHPLPNATGEKSGDVFRRGKTITLSGQIQALNITALETGATFLRQMFNETLPRKLVWYPWEYVADGIGIYLTCRVNQDLAIVQEFDSFDYRYNWTVGLRADDPRTRNIDDDLVFPDWQT